MPELHLPNGASHYYTDSGAIPNNTYTTIVFIHGMGFNGGVFKKLLEPAPKHNFRIVSIYRRDYAPSSAYTDEDRALLGDVATGHRKHLRNNGIALAHFLNKFIVQENIPPVNAAGEGGIIPLGWSLGAIAIHALLSSLDGLEPEVLERLNKYISTVIIHDLSATAIGVVNPPQYDISLWFTPDVQSRFTKFKDWAVAYYKHENIHSGDPSTLTYNLPWELSAEKAAELKLLVSDKPASLSKLSDSDLKELTSSEAFAGSDTQILFTNPEWSKDELRRATFDKALARHLPNTKVRYLASAESPGVLLFAHWELQKIIDNPSSIGGEKARDVKILYTPSGNHFIFWDAPEDALVQYRRCLVE